VTLRSLAARDNAVWCARVAVSHGVTGTFSPTSWAAPRRTPPFYPDAVTLAAGCRADDLLAAVDTDTPGCSVKDSFADLDLAPAGFRVLLEADWIALEAPAAGAPAGWQRVDDAEGLARWATAWAGGAPTDLFRPALLADPEVAFVAVPGTAGGGVLSRSGAAVGVSNVFGDDGTWPALVTAAAELFPGLPLVGWEAADDLAPALAAGFEPCGDLRVWVAD
jgi:hypothetical protein